MADNKLDARVNAYREDLAAQSLKGLVDAPSFSAGELRQVVAPAAPVRRAPRFDAQLDTEALHGEHVTIYDEAEGWAWAQLVRDGYVGYLPANHLSSVITEATHKVAALRTFVYPAPDIKAPPIFWLGFGATVNCAKISGDFLEIGRSRFLFARHVVETDHMDSDYVAVAKRFVGTPYLWGGRQSLGLDCSALVQLALTSAGFVCPRDTDMQEAELGEPLPDPQNVLSFRRGDLLFWPGHVAILAEIGQLLHANAYHMETVIEPLDLALSRIEKAHVGLRAVKRIGSGPEVQ